MVDYGTNRLGIVHRHFGTGNTPAVSSGLTCMSKQTAMERDVLFGSLFPTLHRMEGKGWVQAEWRASENNRRAKYYRLTSSGRAQLRTEERDWSQVVKIMTAAVESA